MISHDAPFFIETLFRPFLSYRPFAVKPRHTGPR
jgi:hypothetical protein